MNPSRRAPTGEELEQLRRVDRACAQVEQSWQDGDRPRIEDSLATCEASDRPSLLQELLQIEWEYRRRGGESFEVAEYRRRFRADAACVERAWAEWSGSAPSAVEDSPQTKQPLQASTQKPEVRTGEPPAGFTDQVLIGQGGMGAVYRAHDPRLDRPVALKMLRAVRPDLLARFDTEAKALAKLSHPHVVQVHALERINGEPCLVMEFVPGGTLEDKLREARISTVESARLVAILARAVQSAHEAGVVHRDLKPANVLMAPEVPGSSGNVLGGFPKVSDFGLARLVAGTEHTNTGQVLGTPSYMPPEQALGRKDVGPPADVWALGVILYRCLTEKLPFTADSALEALDKVRSAPPDHQIGPEVNADLAALCLRCLEKNPSKRPTAGELARSLERLVGQLGGHPTLVPAPARRQQPTNAASRMLIPMLTVAGVLVCAALTLLAAWWFGVSGKPQSRSHLTEPETAPKRLLTVKHLVNQQSDPWVVIGEKTYEMNFKDQTRIFAKFAEPMHAYIIAYNANGTEQLIWPVNEVRKEDENVAPPLLDWATYPHPERGKFSKNDKPVFVLDDEPKGGAQAFAVVASKTPLPPFAEWRMQHGKPAWKRFENVIGVYYYDTDGLSKLHEGRSLNLRGSEGQEGGQLPLGDLYKSLKTPDNIVELLGFPVKAKEN